MNQIGLILKINIILIIQILSNFLIVKADTLLLCLPYCVYEIVECRVCKTKCAHLTILIYSLVYLASITSSSFLSFPNHSSYVTPLYLSGNEQYKGNKNICLAIFKINLIIIQRQCKTFFKYQFSYQYKLLVIIYN